MLQADAATSAACGALMAAGATPLAPLTGLPPALLVAAGLALLPYAVLLAWLSRQPRLPAAGLWALAAVNLVWALDCAWVAFGGRFQPTPPGLAFLGLQALTVLAFAELQVIGLRRSRRAAVA
ncbi:hypothetical protein [Aquabacterium sp. J223]|uniref:hypothetical protein n=1 Tax=Aquabacterium sp. J223 TaxID=2898431 RepID=UPI0021ADFC24|nr:hypothetical protein [Aquabacterium sp. J223]UUX97683.1 hypothetical protein LRS07_10875 [Aquabacterium sp. J223]